MSTSSDKAGRLSFSSHRGGARHRVRYVESSAPPTGECRLCVGSLADRPPVITGLHRVNPAQPCSPRYLDWFTD